MLYYYYYYYYYYFLLFSFALQKEATRQRSSSMK